MSRRIVLVSLGTFLFRSNQLLANGGHEHASNLSLGVKWGLEGVRELVNIHPLFVHFPIALLFASLAFYLLGVVLRKEDFFRVGQWNLYLGTLGAAAAVWSGLQAAKTVPHDDATHALMMMHQYLGIAILVIGVLLSFWLIISKSSLPKGRLIFFVGLFLAVVLLIQQVDFGGRLVYFHGVGMGKKSFVLKK